MTRRGSFHGQLALALKRSDAYAAPGFADPIARRVANFRYFRLAGGNEGTPGRYEEAMRLGSGINLSQMLSSGSGT
jgi:hypothetical protein